MEVSDLLKKVRALEIKSKRLTNHLFTGEYHTAFRGQGMAFKEVREYQPGDDVRFIDWNVSARMDHTYSKVFEEERELSVYLLIDFQKISVLKIFITKIGTVIYLGFQFGNCSKWDSQSCRQAYFRAVSRRIKCQ